MILKGVPVARRKRVNPPRITTSRRRASPACAPRARPNFLIAGRGGADHGGGAVEEAADGVQILLQFIASNGLDDHPGAIGREGAAHVASGAGGIAHVVQAIEEGDEIVVASGKLLRFRDLEADTVGDARFFGLRRRPANGRLVVIEADKGRSRKRFRHDQGGSAAAATDIGDAAAFLEQGLSPLERGNPFRDKVRGVARPKKAFCSLEKIGEC